MIAPETRYPASCVAERTDTLRRAAPPAVQPDVPRQHVQRLRDEFA
jgi:hypothetical protein